MRWYWLLAMVIVIVAGGLGWFGLKRVDPGDLNTGPGVTCTLQELQNPPSVHSYINSPEQNGTWAYTTYTTPGAVTNEYEVTVTNHGSTTLDWTGWVVIFYWRGVEVGNGSVTMGDVYLAPNQSQSYTDDTSEGAINGYIPGSPGFGSCRITSIYG